MPAYELSAAPPSLPIDPAATALVIIDMQRDFLEPDGFGEALGNDVGLLRVAIEPCKAILSAARQAGMLVVCTKLETGPAAEPDGEPAAAPGDG